MTQTAKERFALELKWALIYSLIYLAWMLAERIAGFHDTRLHQQPMVGPLILVPTILIYWLTLRDRKRRLQGQMTYRQGFSSGCALTVFIVILSPLNQLITLKVISPGYFDNLIAATVAAGTFTLEQAREQFSFGNYVVTGLVAGMLMGVFFSAVLAAFARSRNVRTG